MIPYIILSINADLFSFTLIHYLPTIYSPTQTATLTVQVRTMQKRWKGYKSRRHMKVIEIGGWEGEIEVDREIEKTGRAAKTKGKRNTKRTRSTRKIRGKRR